MTHAKTCCYLLYLFYYMTKNITLNFFLLHLTLVTGKYSGINLDPVFIKKNVWEKKCHVQCYIYLILFHIIKRQHFQGLITPTESEANPLTV